MKAMVLCAGKGTRVQPITFSTPKPMINIINRPILSFILEHLKNEGVDQVVINTSYLSDNIESYFGDGIDHGMKISYSYEGGKVDGELQGIAVGSAGGMKRIQDRSGFFDDTFVVLCGDAIIDLDIRALVRFHKERGSVATIASLNVPLEEVDKYGIIVSDENGAITSFQEKPDPQSAQSTLANTGIYVFEPEIFDYIPSATEFDIGSELFPMLIEQGVPFYAMENQFDWIDVGNLDDYVSSNFQVLDGSSPLVKMPGTEVKPGVFVGSNVSLNAALPLIEGPVYIGAGATIKTGAVIKGPAIIGANSVVEANSYIERTITSSYTHIRQNSRVIDKVIFDDWLISSGQPSLKLDVSELAGYVGDIREQPDCIFSEGDKPREVTDDQRSLKSA